MTTRLQLTAYLENSHYHRSATLTGQRESLGSGPLLAWTGSSGSQKIFRRWIDSPEPPLPNTRCMATRGFCDEGISVAPTMPICSTHHDKLVK
jgi:hypothetical protein